MKKTRRLFVLLALLCGISGSSLAATEPTERQEPLPALWEQAGSQERLKAVRAAELDATRLLVERVYGTAIDSDTTIQDLALGSDEVAAEVRRCIRGVTNSEEPKYKDDGQVWVVRAVKLRQILETVTRTVKERKTWRGWIKVEELEKVTRDCKDTVVDALGNSALPGTDGLKKIQAKRAAEIDAYRRLAERMMGVEITSSSKVRDFVLESDEIRARAAAILKGAKPIKIEYQPDHSCEVTMQLKIAEICDVIRHYSKKAGSVEKELIKVEREYEAKTFTEKGSGAPRPEGFAGDVLKSMERTDRDGAFAETAGSRSRRGRIPRSRSRRGRIPRSRSRRGRIPTINI